jgi:phosphatidylserine/phosphatidylglycerophosphate/cardiolipin synthase-like enzyme
MRYDELKEIYMKLLSQAVKCGVSRRDADWSIYIQLDDNRTIPIDIIIPDILKEDPDISDLLDKLCMEKLRSANRIILDIFE